MEIWSINKHWEQEQGHSHQTTDQEEKQKFKGNRFSRNFKMKSTTSAILILAIIGLSASIQAYHVEVS